MRRALRTTDFFVHRCGILSALLILPLVGIVVFDVVERYVFGAPTIWGFELATMMTGAIWILGAGYTLQEKAHVRIDILSHLLSLRVQRVFTLVLFLFVVIPALGLASWSLGGIALEAYLSGERTGLSAWNPPLWPFRAILFLGVTSLLLQVVAEALRCFSGSIPLNTKREG